METGNVKVLFAAILIAAAATVQLQAAEPADDFVPVFVDSLVIGGSNEPPLANTAPEELDITPAPEPEIPLAQTVPLPEDESVQSAPEPPPVVEPGAELPLSVAPPAPPPSDRLNIDTLIGMPLELAEFEMAFSPIISVSDPSLRSRWACDRKESLQEAANKVAGAPVLEMTKRNIDTWRSQSKVLKASITAALGQCDKEESASAAINSELEKAQKAWLSLLESRG